MKYCIRKVPERNTKYLERLLPEAVVVSDVNHNGAIWSFLKAIEIVDDDCIYIQDDMLLCKDFKTRAESYVKQYPDDIISFSSQWQYSHNITQEGFDNKCALWVMCVYIPKDIAMSFKRFMLAEGYKQFYRWQKFIEGQADDTMLERFYFRILKGSVFNTKPSLAGHGSIESFIDKSRGLRPSPMFDYDNAEPKLDGE